MKARILALSLLLVSLPAAQAAYPAISAMQPQGVKRGTEVEVTFTGTRLADVEDILFYESGFTLQGVTPAEDGKKVVAKIAVAPEAALGIHRLRLRSRTGVSDMKLFTVGIFDQFVEVEPNTAFEEAQPITLNQTIEGIVQNEDIDFFRVPAKKGQRISVEIEGWRLGNTLFDPYVAILDAGRFEVARSDDTALLRQDAYCSYVAEADGDYTVMVREASYLGSGACRYRVHIGDYVRPAMLYPLGGKAGQEREFTLLSETGEIEKRKIKLPDAEAAAHPLELEVSGTRAPSPNYVRVSTFDDLMEIEPDNDSRGKATPIPSVPFAANGIVGKDRDRDYFKLTMKKDETVIASVLGTALNSSLDSLLNVYDKDGKHLKSADDVGRNPDASMTFKAPAEGDYFFLVRAQLEKGSPTNLYRLEFTRPEPALRISFPENEQNRSHHRQFIAVARGDRFAALANVRRSSAGGPLDLKFPQLPPGVKLLTPQIKDNDTSFPLVLEAAADAPLGGVLSPLVVSTAEKKVVGGVRQKFDFIRGAPGNTVYYDDTVELLPIVVVEEAPYKLRFEKPHPVAQYGATSLKIIADRKEGFTNAIKLFTLWRPNNVTSPVTISIPKDKNEINITYNANASAAPGTYQLAIVGEGEHNGLTFSGTELIPLEVVPLYLTGKPELTSCEQGKECQMKFALEQKRAFVGEGVATLYGLPKTCTAEPVKFTKDSTELLFTIKVDPKTPPTTYKNLFTRVTLPMGEQADGPKISHQVGAGGVLRVDKPKPPKVEEPEPEKKPAPAPTTTGTPKPAPKKVAAAVPAK